MALTLFVLVAEAVEINSLAQVEQVVAELEAMALVSMVKVAQEIQVLVEEAVAVLITLLADLVDREL
jgi:hypothetical protein